ncbi:MAG: (4Fe-4S)-binding protein [Anaerococcus sp.]|nr:(4Fe-4S)-binding protein [Anaerococcus sp.]MDD7044363.1 (4Fe-4S)-binding protein [Peptoniphilaceae bacterium]MDY2919043.1 (4Fe-4S)-binding protein [Anaerococcus sp.]
MKKYETDELTIYWDPDICQHAGKCTKGLPDVFDVEERPWVMPEKSSAEEIMKVIDKCPSKALSYEEK